MPARAESPQWGATDPVSKKILSILGSPETLILTESEVNAHLELLKDPAALPGKLETALKELRTYLYTPQTEGSSFISEIGMRHIRAFVQESEPMLKEYQAIVIATEDVAYVTGQSRFETMKPTIAVWIFTREYNDELFWFQNKWSEEYEEGFRQAGVHAPISYLSMEKVQKSIALLQQNDASAISDAEAEEIQSVSSLIPEIFTGVCLFDAEDELQLLQDEAWQLLLSHPFTTATALLTVREYIDGRGFNGKAGGAVAPLS